jgi:hypothetical protein
LDVVRILLLDVQIVAVGIRGAEEKERDGVLITFLVRAARL